MRIARVVLATILSSLALDCCTREACAAAGTLPGTRASSSIMPATTRKRCSASTRCWPATAAISRSWSSAARATCN